MRKVGVSLWHHKHGTEVVVAETDKLSHKGLARKVLAAMEYKKADPAILAKVSEAIVKGTPTDVFSIWREHFGAEDCFELLQTTFYEE